MNIKEEMKLFYNDLVEYQNSNEGKALDKAFDSENIEEIEKALNNYYYARNVANKFTYDSLEDKLKGQALDNMICGLYREQN